MKRFAKGTPVAVYWEDAGDHASEWVDSEAVEPLQDLHMVSYGVWIGVKRKAVLLAATYCPSDGAANSVSQIPVGCVKRIAKLKE